MTDYYDVIDKIAAVCYSNKENEAKKLFNEFINTMSFEGDNQSHFYPVLKNILLALENNDLVMMADQLLYELKPLLNGEAISEELINFSVETLPKVDMDLFYITSFFDDELVLCVNKDGKTYNLNSLFSPLNETEYIYKELEVKKTTPLVCLFGVATGLIAEKILDNMAFDGNLLIFEPDKSIIDYCIDSGNIDECDEIEKRVASRLKRIIEDDRTVLCIEEENSLYFSRSLDDVIDLPEIMGMKVLCNGGYTKLYPQSYKTFLHNIKDCTERVTTNRNTYKHFSEDFLDNPLKNLCLCKNAYLCSDLKKIVTEDIPVVIVSAGPSLEKNIKLLASLKGHALIFAVDTALKYLIRENIIPDLTITIDARKQVENFELESVKDIPCIFSGKSNPVILYAQKGKMIFLDGQDSYIDVLLKQLGKKMSDRLGTGGSVATAAFAVAYMLKSKYIILVGQDLAYSGENSHAGGIKEKSVHIDSYTEDIYGNPIKTRSDWVGYIKWFEDAIKLIKESKRDTIVIDATEGGAKIHGSEIMTLKEVIELLNNTEGELKIYDFASELKKLKPLLEDGEYDELCNLHRSSLNGLKKIGIELEDAIRICNSLLSGINNSTVSDSYIHKQNKILSKTRENLEKNLMFALVKTYVAGEDLSKIAELELREGNIKETQINLISAMKLYFETYLDALKQVCEKAKLYEDLL